MTAHNTLSTLHLTIQTHFTASLPKLLNKEKSVCSGAKSKPAFPKGWFSLLNYHFSQLEA